MKLKTCYSICEIEDLLIKFQKKHRIAARMISDNLRRERKASDKHYERSQELIKCEKERDRLKNNLETLDTIALQDRQRISELEHEIKELNEEIDLNNLENAHLNGKIAAYEKILKIEK